MKKILQVLIITIFIFSCSSNENAKIYKSLFLFEESLSNAIRTKDLETFVNMFIQKELSQNEQKTLSEMSFIYELTPNYIMAALKNKGAIYRRIFADNKKSLSDYMPEGGMYDADIKVYTYKDKYIADIKYASPDEKDLYSIEFVLIYHEEKWQILTINFYY